MKMRILLLTLLSGLIFLACVTRPKIVYNLPPDYPADKRKEFIALLDKGKELYKENCSECHGIFTPGKANISNFTNTQFDNYSTRFIRRDPKNHALMMKMSQDQLNQVFAFLRYIKRDTVIKQTSRR